MQVELLTYAGTRGFKTPNMSAKTRNSLVHFREHSVFSSYQFTEISVKIRLFPILSTNELGLVTIRKIYNSSRQKDLKLY